MQWQHPDSLGSQWIGPFEAARKSRSEHCPARRHAASRCGPTHVGTCEAGQRVGERMTLRHAV